MVYCKAYSIIAVVCCIVTLGCGEKIVGENTPNIITTTNDIIIPVHTTKGNTTDPTPTLIPTSTSGHSSEDPITSTTSTTTSTTSTTTSSTTTTPATTSTTTPAPKPTPPEEGIWSYTNGTNVTCIVVQFAAKLNVTYTIVDGNNGTNMGSVILNVPKEAKVINGSCGETEQWLQLTWPENTTLQNNLTLVFKKNNTQQYLEYFKVSLSPQQFPSAIKNSTFELMHNGSDWMSPLSNSYRCRTPSKLVLSGSQKVPVAEVTLTNLQEEAFRKVNTTGFSSAHDCDGGDVPDAVPIAVGCALGGMVAVVLIAYLVGRRRSAARGYLSM
ncbi:Lysosome-associated membrane glycoprotein 1 [Eumeta japonica]|uniref:Lysosome-associated membrane glycoprotein 5 n=1 Tax=Eumeta variegata TaxID=151549 RepID=A0A4C1X598_EUMVA|nr:Lysosome-associated membrane glycoprotein 1 [Eumeta japonica]